MLHGLLRAIKRSALVLAILGIVTAGTGAWLWHAGLPQRWIRAWVVNTWVKKLQPGLPFRIEEADVDANFRDFLHGRISRLSLVVLWEPYRIRATGPIEIKDLEVRYEAVYRPETTIENAHGPESKIERSTPFQLALAAGADHEFKRLNYLSIGLDAPEFKWSLGLGPAQGTDPRLSVKTPHIKADWDGKNVYATISAAEVATTPNATTNIRAVTPVLYAESGLSLSPFSLGEKVRVSFRGEGGEALIGDKYFDIPAKRFPLEVRARLAPESKIPQLAGADITLGPELSLSVEPHKDPRGAQAWRANWRLKPLKIAETLNLYRGLMVSASFMAGIEFPAGALESEGSAVIRAPEDGKPAALESANGHLRARGATVRIPKARFAARGVEVDVPFELKGGAIERALPKVEARDIWFRRAHARLKPLAAKLEGGKFEMPAPQLDIDGIPIRIGAFAGTYSKGAAADASPYSVSTSLKLGSIPYERISKALCIESKRIPPIILSADFSSIQLEQGSIDPTGSVEADFFGGSLRLSEMGFYDLDTPVPEIDFDAQMSGVRLDLLGDWISFGEMDGTLELHAEDVVFQSWLPTQYDFEASVKPLHDGNIVFSPDAMKTLVQLIAKDSMDAIPGIAQWMAFGWPSRVFGGYDVHYAGLRLHSEDGSILLETLDPPEQLAKNPVHYILFGPRFKIPLGTLHYPLVLDATSMGNFVRQMAIQLKEIARAKAEAKAKADAKKGVQGTPGIPGIKEQTDGAFSDEDESDSHPELPADCAPPQL